MWNVRGARLFGLVMCLAVALVLFGTSQLDAKKPPRWEWKVAIPNALAAETTGCNLFGSDGTFPKTGGDITYLNNDVVEVESWTNEDPENGRYTAFSLTISPGGNTVGFRALDFQGCKSYCLRGGEGDCLYQVFPVFPPIPLENAGAVCNDEPYEDCCPPDDGRCGATGYSIMKAFMEQPYGYPTYDYHPTTEYKNFSLRVIVYTDIDSITESVPYKGEGYLWRLNLWNTDEIMVAGNEDYHNTVPAYWIPLEGVVVERTGDDEWTMTVNQCGLPAGAECLPSEHGHSGRWVVFWETYYQGIEILKGKKTRLESEYRWALGTGTPFKFITKWTRY